MVAALNIAPNELRPAERSILLAHADDARRGSRRSSPSEERLTAVSGVGRSQALAARGGLVRHGLIKQVERARFGHVAVYELCFDEDMSVYRDGADLGPAGRTHVQLEGSGPPDAGDRDGSDRPDASPLLANELGPAGRIVGSGGPDPSQGQEEIAGAAAGNIVDQREGEDPRVQEILDAANLGPSWHAPTHAALSAGHSPETVLDALTRPIRDARNPDAVRRTLLKDLAKTRPTPAPAGRNARQPDPPPEPAAPAFPRLSRGGTPMALAATVNTLDTAIDPTAHAMAVLSSTARPPTPAAHDPHTCMDCGKTLSHSRKPWVSRRTGQLVLYCMICKRTHGA